MLSMATKCRLFKDTLTNDTPCSNHIYKLSRIDGTCLDCEDVERYCSNCMHFELSRKNEDDEPMTTRESKYEVSIQMEDNVRKMVLLMKKWTGYETDSKVEEYMDAVSNKLSAAYLAFVALNALLAP